jgi:hypothetical protein
MIEKGLYLFIPLFILILGTGCGDELELPEPQLETPVFSVSAELNGQPFQWQAGVEDYYMFTDFEQDNAGVYTFSGRMAQDDCNNNCAGSLAFYFRGQEARSQGEPVAPPFSPGQNFPFSPVPDSVEVEYQVQFSNLSIGLNPVGGSVFWEFEGQNTPSTDFNPSILYEEEGYYTICLTISSNSCTQVSCLDIQLGGEGNCYTALNYTADSSGQYFLSALPFNGTPPYSYEWSDGSITQQVILSPNILGPQCVTITDAEGCTAEACAIVAYNQGLGNYDICYAGFSYDTAVDTLFVQQNPLQLGTVALAYEAADGKVYRSDFAPGKGQGQLNILSVEPFENNENGLPTQKLEITFSATLYDNSGNSLLLENGTAVIALAYPGQ